MRFLGGGCWHLGPRGDLIVGLEEEALARNALLRRTGIVRKTCADSASNPWRMRTLRARHVECSLCVGGSPMTAIQSTFAGLMLLPVLLMVAIFVEHWLNHAFRFGRER